MAIVNLTPDSFSGDGITGGAEPAAHRIDQVVAEGAGVVDIGGESTRPGATPISAEEELRRILPTVRAAVSRCDVPISVDTRKAMVADSVLAEGAHLINDVSGLHDPDMAAVVSRWGAGVVLVHAVRIEAGEDTVESLLRGLASLAGRALAAGVAEDKIMLDPGLGFGKRWRENLEILRRLSELRALGYPLLVGPSRKGTIGKVLGLPPDQRLEGTAALVTICSACGADMVRVHDVRAMARVARMADALARS
jgi:dihydropteroate synthase